MEIIGTRGMGGSSKYQIAALLRFDNEYREIVPLLVKAVDFVYGVDHYPISELAGRLACCLHRIWYGPTPYAVEGTINWVIKLLLRSRIVGCIGRQRDRDQAS